MPDKYSISRVIRVAPDEGANNIILGDASHAVVGTITVCIVTGSGYAGSITVKARPRNPEAAQPLSPPMPAAPVAFLPIPYLKLNVAGAAVSPPAYDSAPLVGSAIIEIPATGLAISLDCTPTAGEAWVYWTPTIGSAA